MTGSELGPSQQSSSTQRQPLVRALETKKGPGWVLHLLLHLQGRAHQAQGLPGKTGRKFREQGRKKGAWKNRKADKGWDQVKSVSSKRAQGWARKAQKDLRNKVVKVQGRIIQRIRHSECQIRKDTGNCAPSLSPKMMSRRENQEWLQ